MRNNKKFEKSELEKYGKMEKVVEKCEYGEDLSSDLSEDGKMISVEERDHWSGGARKRSRGKNANCDERFCESEKLDRLTNGKNLIDKRKIVEEIRNGHMSHYGKDDEKTAEIGGTYVDVAGEKSVKISEKSAKNDGKRVKNGRKSAKNGKVMRASKDVSESPEKLMWLRNSPDFVEWKHYMKSVNPPEVISISDDSDGSDGDFGDCHKNSGDDFGDCRKNSGDDFGECRKNSDFGDGDGGGCSKVTSKQQRMRANLPMLARLLNSHNRTNDRMDREDNIRAQKAFDSLQSCRPPEV